MCAPGAPQAAHRLQADYGSGQMPHGVTRDVADLVLDGKKIQAIKRYRELNHGVGFEEAKNIIDAI
jgi:ribosomal protein L7/L12